MESILSVEQLMVLSTFLVFLLENWFTRLKVLYGVFLKACDIVPCAVVLSLISYIVWCGLNKSFCSVRMPANCTVLSLHGPVCIQNNYFQFVFILRVKKDGKYFPLFGIQHMRQKSYIYRPCHAHQVILFSPDSQFFWQLQMMGIWSCMMCNYFVFPSVMWTKHQLFVFKQCNMSLFVWFWIIC